MANIQPSGQLLGQVLHRQAVLAHNCPDLLEAFALAQFGQLHILTFGSQGIPSGLKADQGLVQFGLDLSINDGQSLGQGLLRCLHFIAFLDYDD